MTARPGIVDLEAAFDRVSDGVFVLDPHWRFLFINTAAAERIGRTPAEVVGRNVWDEFPAQIGSTFHERGQRAFETQEVVEFVEYFEETGLWFSVRIFPSPEGLTIYFQDVTELRALAGRNEAAQERLRESHAMRVRFEALVEASSDFIAIADLSGQVLYVNPAGREIVGLEPEVDVRDTVIADYLTEEGIRASQEVEVPAVVAHGRWTGETSLLDRRTGGSIPVSVSSFLMLDPETHEPFALATVQRDISRQLAVDAELRRVAGQRQELLDRLVTAQEAERARIAADVHDESVQACAAVALRLTRLEGRLAKDAPHLLPLLTDANEAVETATSQLRELLFDLETADSDYSLIEAVHEAAEHILGDTTTSVSVLGDREAELKPSERGQALRVVKEALRNVRAHAHAGIAQVVVRIVDGGVEFVVADDGVGIDPETVTSPPGHHGLAGMRDRCEIAGGWFRFERSEPSGTQVRFFIPA
ncbi:MAG TPA: PAS domain-containing protein [Jatrophihabitans sp.]|jgi:PAS domain S-box-containing protein|uniref:PAS domain-containing sensor histidine kinase n=1 Tax=Jatrophihabitans sp. TaxID=1932789 RepID=UPI002DFA8416|nr:PAS domain-containing protein [Jatrophihabitans sp.]